MTERLRQDAVDKVRARVYTSLIINAVKQGKKSIPVKHLRFFKGHTRAYELRDGNPPSDTDRTKPERGLRLEIDVGEIGSETDTAVRDFLRTMKTAGQTTPTPRHKEIAQLAFNHIVDRGLRVLGVQRTENVKTPVDLTREEMQREEDIKARMVPGLEKARTRVKVFPTVEPKPKPKARSTDE